MANKFGLAGKTEWEKAEADAYVDLINCLGNKVVDLIVAYAGEEAASQEDQRQEAGKKKEATEKDFDQVVLPEFLNPIQKRLQDNESGFLVGDSLTWADLVSSTGP